jgi:hypothetical protein
MKINIAFVFLLIWAMPGTCLCQQSISGPTCVVTGPAYQYNLKLNWDGITEMNLCVDGGKIENQSTNCLKSTSLPYIRINWNADIVKGSLSISYGSLKDSIIVFVTTPLSPGVMDTAKKVQTIINGGIPKQINCSVATGGNCKPVYSYQWQQSSDAQSWQNIDGFIGQNISFNATPTQNTFYRRKTTENKSRAIAYSEVAIIVILAADVRAGNQ